MVPRDIHDLRDDAGIYLLMDVLEHIEDDKTFLQSIVAFARPGEYLPNNRSRASSALVGARRHGRSLSSV